MEKFFGKVLVVLGLLCVGVLGISSVEASVGSGLYYDFLEEDFAGWGAASFGWYEFPLRADVDFSGLRLDWIKYNFEDWGNDTVAEFLDSSGNVVASSTVVEGLWASFETHFFDFPNPLLVSGSVIKISSTGGGSASMYTRFSSTANWPAFDGNIGDVFQQGVRFFTDWTSGGLSPKNVIVRFVGADDLGEDDSWSSDLADSLADEFFGADRQGSAWTQARTGESFCSGVDFETVVLTGGNFYGAAWFDEPQAGTIYVVEPGYYTPDFMVDFNASKNCVVIVGSGDVTFDLEDYIDGVPRYFFSGSGMENVIFAGIKLDYSPPSSSTTTELVAVENSQNFTFSGIVFTGSDDLDETILWEFHNSSYFSFVDSVFADYAGVDNYLLWFDVVEDFRLENLSFRDASGGDMEWSLRIEDATGVVIRDLDFENVSQGFSLGGVRDLDAQDFRAVNVSRPLRFNDSNLGDGVEDIFFSGLVISGSMNVGDPDGIFFDGDFESGEFRGLEIRGITGSNSDAPLESSNSADVFSGIRFVDVEISDSRVQGMYFLEWENLLFENVSIENVGQHGVILQGLANSRFVHFSVSGAGDHGMYFPSAGNTLEFSGLTIENIPGGFDGVQVGGSSIENRVFTGVEIRGIGDDGMVFPSFSSGARVTDLVIQDVGGDAVEIPNSQNVVFQNVVIEGGGDDGFDLGPFMNFHILSGFLSGFAGDAIGTWGNFVSGFSLENLEIRNAKHGVYLPGGATGFSVSGLEIFDVSEQAVELSGDLSDLLWTGVRISNPGSHGILLGGVLSAASDLRFVDFVVESDAQDGAGLMIGQAGLYDSVFENFQFSGFANGVQIANNATSNLISGVVFEDFSFENFGEEGFEILWSNNDGVVNSVFSGFRFSGEANRPFIKMHSSSTPDGINFVGNRFENVFMTGGKVAIRVDLGQDGSVTQGNVFENIVAVNPGRWGIRFRPVVNSTSPIGNTIFSGIRIVNPGTVWMLVGFPAHPEWFTGAQFENVVVAGAQRQGIEFDGHQSSFRNIEVFGSWQENIHIDGDENVIEFAKIYNSRAQSLSNGPGHGLVLNGNRNIVNNSMVFNSAEQGIVIGSNVSYNVVQNSLLFNNAWGNYVVHSQATGNSVFNTMTRGGLGHGGLLTQSVGTLFQNIWSFNNASNSIATSAGAYEGDGELFGTIFAFENANDAPNAAFVTGDASGAVVAGVGFAPVEFTGAGTELTTAWSVNPEFAGLGLHGGDVTERGFDSAVSGVLSSVAFRFGPEIVSQQRPVKFQDDVLVFADELSRDADEPLAWMANLAPVCGNGIHEIGEFCDAGQQNSASVVGRCNLSCSALVDASDVETPSRRGGGSLSMRRALGTDGVQNFGRKVRISRFRDLDWSALSRPVRIAGEKIDARLDKMSGERQFTFLRGLEMAIDIVAVRPTVSEQLREVLIELKSAIGQLIVE